MAEPRIRYASDDEPGITRRAAGSSFAFFDASGRRVRDAATLARIRALAIPPAYRDVWICADANGHLQATARDARGRKQYVYHPVWSALRDKDKFDRLAAFAAVLPAIRRRLDRDLKRKGMPKEKVLAAIVRIMDLAFVRVGNEEYARENHSYGLTTAENRHVKTERGHMRLSFTGKSGVRHDVPIDDPRVRRIVAACHDLPGHELFGFVDDAGRAHDVTSGDVNAYLKEVAHADITAKDFRTWHGTVIAAAYLRQHPVGDTKTGRKARVSEAIAEAAAALGNTRAVCRKRYVHPRILAAYDAGTLSLPLVPANPSALHVDERFVLAFLRRA